MVSSLFVIAFCFFSVENEKNKTIKKNEMKKFTKESKKLLFFSSFFSIWNTLFNLKFFYNKLRLIFLLLLLKSNKKKALSQLKQNVINNNNNNKIHKNVTKKLNKIYLLEIKWTFFNRLSFPLSLRSSLSRRFEIYCIQKLFKFLVLYEYLYRLRRN